MFHMFFRLDYYIKALNLGKADSREFTIIQEGATVNIDLKKVEAERRPSSLESGDILLSGIFEKKISQKQEKEFLNLKSPISNSIAELSKEVTLFLSRTLNSFIKTYRWRLRSENASNPIRSWGGLYYSVYQTDWKPIPDQIKLTAFYGLPMAQDYSDEEIASLQEIMHSFSGEPVGHELLHEAWELRRSNPRSAIVIGLAAIESGFKEFASKMIPQASWLIEEVASPPLEKMFRDFLPQIPTAGQIYGKTIPSPEDALDILKKGVGIRNKIVHGRAMTVKTETVEEVLNLVRDLLYLLDFYSGHRWAWTHINTNYLNALIETAKPKQENKKNSAES